jgi:hypothetical protein
MSKEIKYMAGIPSKGSMRDFNYTDDGGTVWGLKLDESNTELVNLSGDTGAAVAIHRAPRNLKPRYVIVTDVTGQIKRKCIVLNLARYAALSGTNNFTLAAVDPNATTQVAVGRKVPEQVIDIIKNFDTGLTDGDNP